MSIPKDAKLVFKGLIFDVYQWEQKLFDGSVTTFEGLKRASTIQIIPILGDKILLAREEQPTKPLCFTFLGGRGEEGEEPEETTKRELLEETGMEAKEWELMKTYQFGSKIDWTTYLFIAKDCQKVAEPQLEAGEKIEVVELTFDEFIDHVTREDFWGNHQIIADFFRMRLDPKKLEEFRKRLLSF